MSDSPTQPFYAERGPRPGYDPYLGYPPEPPRRSGWLVALAATSVVALVAVGVLVALLLDARKDLIATKATLAETRAAVDQTSSGAAELQQQLATANQSAARLQADVKRLKNTSATSASALKQREQQIKDLRTCGDGFLQMYHLQTAELQSLQADPFSYTPSREEIERTLDEIRGACDRVQLAAGPTP